MRDFAQHSPLLLCLIIVVCGAMASLVPVSPVEPVLVAVAAVAPVWLLPILLVLVTASHMSTKTLVFIGGGKVDKAYTGRHRARFDRARERLAGRGGLQRCALFLSSMTGLPPFYVVTALCGSLKMPLRHFLIVATTGRTIRFAALIFLPQLFRAAPLAAQPVTPAAVTVSGRGPETYVLISGVVGGVGGFKRIESRLVQQGMRVISIDPYQLSIDAPDVSFDAMARRVEKELAARGVQSAKVVGHGHGGSVAVRLAAIAPQQVSALYLIEAGPLGASSTPTLGASLRLVPLITRLPSGRSFVRNHFLAGLKANSATTAWLDDSTARAYTDPVLDHIGSAIALARRLATAEEPEQLAAVLGRVHVPVTLILGQVICPASVIAADVTAFESLGALVRIERLPGVGHFPHEESPDEVVRQLVRPRTILVAGNGGGR